MRTLLDWCVSFAPNQGGEEAAAIKKKKRGLWLVGAEARNASYTDAHLEGTASRRCNQSRDRRECPVNEGSWSPCR